MAAHFKDYDTASVANGTVKIGDRVRIEERQGEWLEGTVSRITRTRPLRANKTYIEIVDDEGVYLTAGCAKRFHKV